MVACQGFSMFPAMMAFVLCAVTVLARNADPSDQSDQCDAKPRDEGEPAALLQMQPTLSVDTASLHGSQGNSSLIPRFRGRRHHAYNDKPPCSACSDLKDVAEDLQNINQELQKTHQELRNTTKELGNTQQEFQNTTQDLEETVATIPEVVAESATDVLSNFTDEVVQNLLSQETSRPTPIPFPVGICNVSGAIVKEVCNITEAEGCNVTISNQPARASSNGSNGAIITGCGLIEDEIQELFQVCNADMEERLIRATTCGTGNASFDHKLAAYITVSSKFTDLTGERVEFVECATVACADDTRGPFPCEDTWQGPDLDPRTTIEFLLTQDACAYIVQQPGRGGVLGVVEGNDTDVLFISSQATTTTTTSTTTATSIETTTSATSTSTNNSGVVLLAELSQERPTKSDRGKDVSHISIAGSLSERPRRPKPTVAHRAARSLGPDMGPAESMKIPLPKPGVGPPIPTHSKPVGKSQTPLALRKDTKVNATFGLCSASSARARAREASDMNDMKELKLVSKSTSAQGHIPCDPDLEVATFDPSTGQYACCGHQNTFCSGCASLASNGAACDQCLGGFVATASGCEACMDFEWRSRSGESCADADCQGEKVKEVSAREACCRCGGGHRAATPFSYYVGPLVLASTSVVGHPVPRTASDYFVNDGCQLLQFGFTIDGRTGELKLKSGCTQVGCGAAEAFSTSCTITAREASGLTAEAELSVTVAAGPSYGSYPLIFVPGQRAVQLCARVASTAAVDGDTWIYESWGSSDFSDPSAIGNQCPELPNVRSYHFVVRNFVGGPEYLRTERFLSNNNRFAVPINPNNIGLSGGASLSESFQNIWKFSKPSSSRYGESSAGEPCNGPAINPGGPSRLSICVAETRAGGRSLQIYGGYNSDSTEFGNGIFACFPGDLACNESIPSPAALEIYVEVDVPQLEAIASSPALQPGGPSLVDPPSVSCVPHNLEEVTTVAPSTWRVTLAGVVTESHGGVSIDPFSEITGGICSLSGNGATSSFMAVVPHIWNFLKYDPDTLYATFGQEAPVLMPVEQPGKLAPSRFSAAVSNLIQDERSKYVFDIFTGVMTYDSYQLFQLDVKTGALKLDPAEELAELEIGPTRASLTAQFVIYAFYEWPPLQTGPVLSYTISIEARDTNCWIRQTHRFKREELVESGGTEIQCRRLCARDFFCTHYRHTSSLDCIKYSQLCALSETTCLDAVEVYAKYSGCAERTSCLEMKITNAAFLSGEFCPAGESSDGENGQVFLKEGRTQQDSFWLVFGEEDNANLGSACLAGNHWILKESDPQNDYLNDTSSYVELYGAGAACLKPMVDENSWNLVTDAFDNSPLDIRVATTSNELQGQASVLIPSCGPPNVTQSETVEGKLEESEVVSALILDDPGTPVVDDYWLHPCQCIPPAWGQEEPVTAEALEDVPAGSLGAGFLPRPYEIVSGAFVCDQKFLLSVELAIENEALTQEQCEIQCKESAPCRFFWHGNAGGGDQCWLYSDCRTLYRSLGLAGTLFAFEKSQEVCRMANAEICWFGTKRRQFLGAYQSDGRIYLPDCLHQSLFVQCDQKQMLGGSGTSEEGCGSCKYVAVDSSGEYLVVPPDFELEPENDEPNLGAYEVVSPLRALVAPSNGYAAQCPLGSRLVACRAFPGLRANGDSWTITDRACELTSPRAIASCSWAGETVVLDKAQAYNGCPSGFFATSCWSQEMLNTIVLFGDAFGPPIGTTTCPFPKDGGEQGYPRICQKPSTSSRQKRPLPISFEHGRSLVARCWSERFVSASSSVELRCVAGKWRNEAGSLGLANFACTSCIQVVSKQYRDLLAKNKQELFFGSRWHLQLLLGELGGEFYKLLGCSRLVAQFASGDDYQRQFREVCFANKLCVTARSNTLTFEECQPSSQQLLNGQDLGLLFLQDYKQRTNSEASYDSVVDTSQDLGVDEFTKQSLNVACETNQAVRKLSFGVGGLGAGDSGLSGSCTSTVLRGPRRDRGVTLPFSFRNEGTDRCLQHAPCTLNPSQQCLQSTEEVLARCSGKQSQLFFLKKRIEKSPYFQTVLTQSNEGFRMYLDDNFDNEVHWESWIRFPLRKRQSIRETEGPVKGLCRLNTETGTDARSFECSDGKRRVCLSVLLLAQFDCAQAMWLGSVESNSFRLEAIEINLDRRFRTYLAPHFKPTTSNQFFWRADNLGGLDSLQLTCGVGEVITSFSKVGRKISWTCQQVLGLGACVEKTSLEQVEIDSKERGLVEIDCAEGHVIKKLETEVNYVTESFRLKATCCFVASMPFTLRPYQQFDTADVDELSGIFCPKPEGLDDSGRPEFSQQLSFRRSSSAPQAELQYDKALGKWCLKEQPSQVCASTDPAVESDVVHPLNLALGRFYVVPMTNFDGVFETPVGVARDAATPQPPPKPTLITFSATSPDFAAECQDENTPGTPTFDRERMNQKAQELLNADSEHPCGYIFSEPRTSREVAAPGLSWWPQSDVSPYAGTIFRGVSGGFDGGDETGRGVTYRTVTECSERVKSRKIDNSADKFPITTGLFILDKLKDDKQAIAEAVVKLSAGLGAETEWSPGLTLNAVLRKISSAGKAVLTTYERALERDFNKANANDCDPLQHGLARIFCDLYCIRDFVKKGDAAILQNLQSATDTLNQNLQELFSFYAGSGGQLEQNIEKLLDARGVGVSTTLLSERTMAAGLRRSLEEMQSLLSGSFPASSRTAAMRSLQAFQIRLQRLRMARPSVASAANGTSISESLTALSSEVQKLRAAVGSASARGLSNSQAVAKKTADYVHSMNQVWKSKAHQLGVYRRVASRSKQRQSRLHYHATHPSLALKEIQHEARRAAVSSLDRTWWQIRAQLDSYFEAMDKYWQNFKAALVSLDGYTSRCSLSFPELKKSYQNFVQVDREAHETLMSVWKAVNPLVGFLASEIVDSQLLEAFAHDQEIDSRVLDGLNRELAGNSTEPKDLCRSEEAKNLTLQMLKGELMDGLFGQTVEQLSVLFAETGMLEDRFLSSNLSPPNVDVLRDSQKRLQEALDDELAALPKRAEALWQTWSTLQCGTINFLRRWIGDWTRWSFRAERQRV